MCFFFKCFFFKRITPRVYFHFKKSPGHYCVKPTQRKKFQATNYCVKPTQMEHKDDDANPAALMAELRKQNAMLLERMTMLEKQNAEFSKQLKQQQPNKPPPKSPPRRSPRRHASKRAPKKPVGTPKTKKTKKKLFQQQTHKKEKKTRTPSTPKKKKIRKTLGDTFKAQYDKAVLKGKFKDNENNFKLDLFEDCVRPIIVAMQRDEDLDTADYTYTDIFKIGMDVVKKRQRYTPRSNFEVFGAG